MKNTSNISPVVMRQYKAAANWKSDLDYLLRESKFLHHLFEGYYLNFSSEYYIRQLRTIESALSSLDRNIKEINGFLEIQLAVIDGMLTGDGKTTCYRSTDLDKIEQWINQVRIKFRALKDSLFQFVEDTQDINETLSFLDRSA